MMAVLGKEKAKYNAKRRFKDMLPDKFNRIEQLSDAARKSDHNEGGHTAAEITPRAVAKFNAEYASKQPRPLSAALDALSDEDFRELMGWVLFGREYTPEDGNPYEVLSSYIRDAIIYPRDTEAGYLEQKPIGQYLRDAVQHLETTTSKDIERAQHPERFEEDYQENYD